MKCEFENLTGDFYCPDKATVMMVGFTHINPERYHQWVGHFCEKHAEVVRDTYDVKEERKMNSGTTKSTAFYDVS